MTPRERALGCHDILLAIFDQLAPVPSDGFSATEESRWICRKALASSARTCTTLSFHALNALWRELDSIHPLIKVLPNCKLVERHLMLRGAISDEGWGRFQFYAERVRSIIAPRRPEIIPMDLIHPSIWPFLAVKSKGSPLMPRIRDLSVLDLRNSETSAFILQLSPSLRTLYILFPLVMGEDDRKTATNVTNSLLETIPAVAPNLEQFSCDVDVDISPGFIQSFWQCTRLKTLSIPDTLALDDDALQMLPPITSLRELTCCIELSSKLNPLRSYTFQLLTQLQVAGSFDDLTAFIVACQLPSLTSITLQFNQPPIAKGPLDSLTAICQRCNPTLLTSFNTSILYPFPANTPTPNCLMEYFEPLLSFPNLEHFNLWYSNAVPSVHDDDLTRMGTAWPRLSHFSVSRFMMKHLDAPPELVRPTLAGLVDLARRCPHLEAFRVPELDAKVVPEEDAALPPRVGHGLQCFWVDDVALPSSEPPAHLAEVAGVLDRVFPSMELVELEAGSRVNGWVRLLQLLKTTRLSREP